jgi:Domain of unknown function (DUF4274)
MALSQAQKDRVQALVYDEYLVCSDDEETEADREATRAAFEGLMSQIESPEELHAYANEFNWDGGCKEMRDVIRHPLCDMGTALLIYWHAGAGYYLRYADRSEVGEGEIEKLELMEEIEQRVQDQQFKTATQPFDPRNDMGTDLTTLYEDEAKALKKRKKVPFHPIPTVLYQAVTGE